MDPAEFLAVTVYTVVSAAKVGVPEIEQFTGESTSPSGRLVSDDSSHDVTTLPPVQNIIIGSIGSFIRSCTLSPVP